MVFTADGNLRKHTGNIVLKVSDSWEELNWLFGDNWLKFNKQEGEKTLVFSMCKRLWVRIYFNRRLMALTVSMSYKCEIGSRFIYGNI